MGLPPILKNSSPCSVTSWRNISCVAIRTRWSSCFNRFPNATNGCMSPTQSVSLLGCFQQSWGIASTANNHYDNAHARTIFPIQIRRKFVNLYSMIVGEVREFAFQGKRNVYTTIGMKLSTRWQSVYFRMRLIWSQISWLSQVVRNKRRVNSGWFLTAAEPWFPWSWCVMAFTAEHYRLSCVFENVKIVIFSR